MPPHHFEGARLPVLSWAPELEEGALRQAQDCANLPVAHHHVAVMADGHQGYGVPIGAVLALDGALSPYAVGNDIGCGMAVVPTTLTTDEVLAPVTTRSGAPGAIARDDIMGWVQTTIPSGNEAHRDPPPDRMVTELLAAAYDAMEQASAASRLELTTSQSTKPGTGRPLPRDAFEQRGLAQAGTLGSGNHFIELLAGPEDEVWVMLHSGSRGVGSAICNNFHRMALEHCHERGHDLPDPGLAWLPRADDAGDRWAEVGECYERAMKAGLLYAERNRQRMLEAIGDIVERRFPGVMQWDGIVNIHHNDATFEHHFERDVWVHRKGAVKAAEGTDTITPGSMGSATYLGVGLGNPESFESCSHGAGRVRSRGRARAELSLDEELAAIARAGGKVFAGSTAAVLDEMPGAYKDLDAVMEHQADLVRPVRRLTPLGTYKGSEQRSRRRKKGGWRPDEER